MFKMRKRPKKKKTQGNRRTKLQRRTALSRPLVVIDGKGPFYRLEDLPLLLTIPEAAKILRIGRNLAYEAARQGQLPTIDFGRRRFVIRAALQRKLEQA